MKSSEIQPYVTCALLMAGAAWILFYSPSLPIAPEATKPNAATAAEAKTQTSPSVATAPMAGAPAPMASSASQASPSPTPSGDPAVAATQAELNATIDDVDTLLNANDLVGLFDKYTPPEELAAMTPQAIAGIKKQIQQRITTTPERQQALQQAWQTLRNQTPALNAPGDEATYHITLSPGMFPPGANVPAVMPTIPVVFEKVNGRWYIKSGSGFTG